MNELFLIDSITNVKEVFGNLRMLEDCDELDMLQICSFAKIVNNYIKMDKKLNETRNTKIRK